LYLIGGVGGEFLLLLTSWFAFKIIAGISSGRVADFSRRLIRIERGNRRLSETD
jgi:hypothetical protein